MALNWEKHPGAWSAGPYMVAQRTNGNWNATALFKSANGNTDLTIELDLPSMAAAMDACEEAHLNITTSLRNMDNN